MYLIIFLTNYWIWYSALESVFVITDKMNLFKNELPSMQHAICNLNSTWNNQINVVD